jgi:sugar phosphate isomerase/epimerase
MKLAYSTNAYRRFALDDAVERVARIGYPGVELMADEPHVWPGSVEGERVDAIRRCVEEHGLSVANVNAFMMTAVGDFHHPSWIAPDAAARRQRVDHTIAALRFASRVGAPCITTEPGGPLERGAPRGAAMDRFVEGLGEALRVAEEVGVLLLVEPEPGLLIENVAQFLDLARRIASPMFGLNFDIGHFYCVRESLPAAIDRLQGYARHYHIEDIAATRVHEHLIPGRGAIDLYAALRAIHATAYTGWITVELYPYLDDPDAAGREALDHLTRIMPR